MLWHEGRALAHRQHLHHQPPQPALRRVELEPERGEAQPRIRQQQGLEAGSAAAAAEEVEVGQRARLWLMRIIN